MTRTQARTANLSRYFTGKPCRRGHIAERQTVNATCVICQDESKRACYRRDSTMRARHNAKYYSLHAALVRALNVAWRADNPDRLCAIRHADYQENKAQYRIRSIRRKRWVAQATPAWVDLVAIRRVYEDAMRRTLETGIQHDVDHIVPLRGKNVCGLHVPWNLQVITSTFNRLKGNRAE